jgi:hypothetical protein
MDLVEGVSTVIVTGEFTDPSLRPPEEELSPPQPAISVVIPIVEDINQRLRHFLFTDIICSSRF